MNILLIHNYYQKRGGEDTVFENETNALKKQGHTVIVYSRHNDEIKKFNLFQKLFFIFDSIYNKKTVNDLKKILSKNKIDIAHVHNVFPLISCSVYSYLKKRNIKIVQTIHNYRFLCPNGQFFRNNKNCNLCKKGNFLYCILLKCYKNSFLFSCLYAFIIKKYQHVFKNDINGYIALSGFTKKLFIEAGYNKEKFFIKDNAFVNSKMTPKKPKDYFLFLGRISSEKGIDFLLDAFYKNDRYNLIVAGTGENIKNLKEKFKSKKIVFKNFLQGKEKIKIFQRSIALIVPSIWLENYPMSIVEAFSFHVPVIASNIGGLPYIIDDESNGLLFEPENINSLNNKLDYIYINKKQRDKMSINAYKTFLSRMEISKNILILEKIYKEVINAK